MNDDPTVFQEGEVLDGGVTSAEDPSADGAAGDPFAALAAMTAERDEYLDQLRRKAAEFDNYRKRMLREQDAIRERAGERIVHALLPVLDDLERAVDAFDAHEPEAIRKGVEIVHRALGSLLEREGVVVIAPEGEPFDPHRHEVLLAQPADAPEGTVIQVVQKGFLLGDRVLRPARVVVAAPRE